MIKRVRVKGYKSLEDVEVTLQPLTVFIGPNAAGKSNLFDALGLLSRMVTSNTLNEAFEKHRGAPLEAFQFGEKGLQSLLDRGSAQFSIEVDVQLSRDVIDVVEKRLQQLRTKSTPETPSSDAQPEDRVLENHLRYSLTVEVEVAARTGQLSVIHENLTALTPEKDIYPFIEIADGKTVLRDWVPIDENDARKDVLTTVYSGAEKNFTLASASLRRYPFNVHIAAFCEELSRWRFYYFEPAAMREKSALRPATSLEPSGRDLAAYFNYLKAESPAQFDAMNRALHLLIPRVDGIDVQVTSDGYLQLYVIEDGVPFPASIVSEGTLRVLGLLAVTNSLSPVSVVGYEEPENGVHPARMRLLAKLLANAADPARGRQILVNTHSPLMPSYILDELMPPLSKEGLVVNCRREGRATRFEPVEVSGPLFFGDDLDETIDDAYLPETSLVERILRGDFGG
ncbi:MAG: AAA family ATPase [Anaerolineae bacterium]